MNTSNVDVHALNPEVIATLKSLQEATGGDFLTKVYSIFQTQTKHNLELLKRAADAGDFTTVRSLAHGIKGSCLQIGAKSMSDLAREIEGFAEKQMSKQVIDAVQRLTTAHDEAIELLNRAFFG